MCSHETANQLVSLNRFDNGKTSLTIGVVEGPKAISSRSGDASVSDEEDAIWGSWGLDAGIRHSGSSKSKELALHALQLGES